MKWVTVTSVLLIWRRFQTFSTRTNVKDVFQRPQVHQHKASGQWTAFHFETTWNRTHSIWWPYFPPLGTARPSMTHTLWTRSPVGLYNRRDFQIFKLFSVTILDLSSYSKFAGGGCGVSSIRRLFDAPSRSRSNFRFRPPSWMTSLPFPEAEIAPAPWWGIKKLSQYWINILVDHHLI